MGIFTWFANRHYRKEIGKLLNNLETASDKELATILLAVFAARDIRLFPDTSQYDHFKSMGIDDETIKEESIYVYQYKKGNEIPLLKKLDNPNNVNIIKLALKVHLYTTLALSYEGYDNLLRMLWNKLFEGSPYLSSVYKNDDTNHDRHISVTDFINNPRSIIPKHIGNAIPTTS